MDCSPPVWELQSLFSTVTPALLSFCNAIHFSSFLSLTDLSFNFSTFPASTNSQNIPKLSPRWIQVQQFKLQLNSLNRYYLYWLFQKKQIEKIWLRDSTFSRNNSIGIWISVLKSIKCWPDFFCCSLFIQLHLSVTDVFQNLPDFAVKPQIFSSFIPKPG